MDTYDYHIQKYLVNFGFRSNKHVRSFIIMNRETSKINTYFSSIFIVSVVQRKILVQHRALDTSKNGIKYNLPLMYSWDLGYEGDKLHMTDFYINKVMKAKVELFEWPSYYNSYSNVSNLARFLDLKFSKTHELQGALPLDPTGPIDGPLESTLLHWRLFSTPW